MIMENTVIYLLESNSWAYIVYKLLIKKWLFKYLNSHYFLDLN